MNKIAAMVVLAAIAAIAAGTLVIFSFGDWTAVDDNEENKDNASPQVLTVTIINEGFAPDDATFSPDTINVQLGTTVLWDNSDRSAHTVTSGLPSAPTGVFDSRIMSPDDRFEFTFEDEGVFDYYCILHPMMIGSVVVQ